MEKRELDAITYKYERLMRRFYSGTVKYRMRIGNFVLKNLVKTENGERLTYIGSFNAQLANIKRYIKDGIERFQKRHPRNEDLKNDVLFYFEKIDEAQCSEDIINIINSIDENDNFKEKHKNKF